MNTVFALLVLLSFSLCTGCLKRGQSEKKSNPEINNHTIVIKNKFDKMKKHLMHKKITSLNKILNTPESKTDTRILYSYTSFDCSSCVEASFQLIKGLSERDKQRLVTVASFSSPGNDQLRYNYDQLIYSDTNDLLRRELKYYYTPVIFIINQADVIMDVFFVTTYADKKKQVDDFKIFWFLTEWQNSLFFDL